MVITSPSKHRCFDFYNKFKQDHPDMEIFSENIHPYDAEDWARTLNESAKMIICFNTVVLDYIDLDCLYAITENLQLVKFREFYQEQLEYMYAGEIVLNACEE